MQLRKFVLSLLNRNRQECLSYLLFFLLINCTGIPFSTDKGGHTRDISIVSSATIIRSEEYKVLGKSEGESSTYMFLGIIPLTDPLNIEYALSQAVQKVEGGQSMVNIEVWHETHYYFPVGKVSVVKVRGDVVSLTAGSAPIFENQKGKEVKVPDTGDGGLKVKKQDDSNSDGGLKVGGKKKKGGVKLGGTE